MAAESVRPYHRLRVWYRPMRGRDPGEPHRAATPLELLFDLCFVVAVGRAAAELHHAVAENHAADGVVGFLLVFFAIWWAWLNFTWFASAFDTDDVPYRIATFVQIGGGLVLAAGVASAFEGDFTIIVIGYVVMRLALVGQWLRAAAGDPRIRPTALRFALGIALVQAGWVARLAVPEGWLIPSFLVLAAAEMLVPIWAERASAGTTWHAHHIAERYGLFTIIVLGEAVISGTAAVQEGFETGEHTGSLVSLAVAGLAIMFAMWWLYFDQPAHRRLTSFWTTFAWGYGHLLIFASAAAVGAGLEVAVDHVTEHAALSDAAAGMAVTVPVAVFLLSVWLMHIGPRNECRPIAVGFPAAAVLTIAASFVPAPVHVTAGILVALVATVVIATHGEPDPTAAPAS
ncbi:low temperature requirement protein A [Prauserella muralis]|uniref:Low temperature requirement protein A n=1 Tax=Prauserella muralis TaxID=588067 RepID=A0A2V4AYX9_9PSEU|nr:low temperature requirement protein A [Prauserella muralis]PXY27221.1 low temperature requirement protein A [Prauserella muralis]TWE23123.1 low temperature requirement protein LtrA [Prauserella muralis]